MDAQIPCAESSYERIQSATYQTLNRHWAANLTGEIEVLQKNFASRVNL